MNGETMSLLEDRIQKELYRLETVDEENQPQRSRILNDVVKLTEKLTEAEMASERWYDDEARREIEKSRIEAERNKQNLDWKRMCLEVGKILAPIWISWKTLQVWQLKFDDMLKFEESGRFTTSASREVHLPKIFGNTKWW